MHSRLRIPNSSLFLALSALTSCASITVDDVTKVRIESNPPGCRWEGSHGGEGYTPGFAFLPNGETVVLSFFRPGDSTPAQLVTSVPGLSPAILGNVIAGGVVGALIDFTNPKTRSHTEFIKVDLGVHSDGQTRTDLPSPE